jgi:hypothetical protein
MSPSRRIPYTRLLGLVLILAPLLLLMIGALEAVIVASIALSVHEVAVSAVRYAAVNPAAAQAAVVSYAKSVAPSLINDQYLTLTLSPSAGGRLTGTSVSFTASYSLAGKTFATTSILGMTFPSSLSSTVTMTSE